MALLIAAAKLLSECYAEPAACLCQCTRVQNIACSALHRPTVQQRCLGTCMDCAWLAHTQAACPQDHSAQGSSATAGQAVCKASSFCLCQCTVHNCAAHHPANCSWQQRTCRVGAAPSKLLLRSGLMHVTGMIQAQWAVLP